jgi:hypothetical protein
MTIPPDQTPEQREQLTEYAARAFLRHLQTCYPGSVWVRVREDERPDIDCDSEEAAA